MTLDPLLQAALRAGLALLLLHACTHKLRAPAHFAAALAAYRVLPRALAPAAAALVIAVELAIGLALWVPGLGAAAALAAAGLLSVYALAIALNLARGRRDLDCGCAGPAARRPISGALVVRNALLVGAALLASLPAGARSLSWLDLVTGVAAVAAASCLYASAEGLLAHRARLTALRGIR